MLLSPSPLLDTRVWRSTLMCQDPGNPLDLMHRFFTEAATTAICFYCGLCLYQWAETDVQEMERIKYWSSCAYLERTFATGFIAQLNNFRIPQGQFLSSVRFGFATPEETADPTFVRNPPIENEEQPNQIPPPEVKKCEVTQELVCKVCFDAQVNALATPCGHCFWCLNCTAKFSARERLFVKWIEFMLCNKHNIAK